MNKGIYRIAAGIGAAVILVSSCTVQASMVMTNGTPAAVATDSIANWPAAPAVTSETAVLMDADTGAILYDKGMDEYRYPASTTKLMTLLIAIENSSPKDVVTFTETGVRDVTWDSSNINAQLGETMTMKDCTDRRICRWYGSKLCGDDESESKEVGMHAYTFCKCERSSGRKPLFLCRRSCEDHAGRT